jgi:hypothetical protein
VEKRAVEHVRVDPEHRRLGVRPCPRRRRSHRSRLRLVYPAINETIEARAFWASVGLPGPGIPAYCSHMRQSSGIASDARCPAGKDTELR